MLTLTNFGNIHIQAVPPKVVPHTASSTNNKSNQKKSYGSLIYYNLQSELDNKNSRQFRAQLIKQNQYKHDVFKNKLEDYMTKSISTLIKNLYTLELSDYTRENCIRHNYKKYFEIQKKLCRLFNESELEGFLPMQHSMEFNKDKSITVSDDGFATIHEINCLSIQFPAYLFSSGTILPLGEKVFARLKPKRTQTIQYPYVPSDSERKMWKNFCPACKNLNGTQLYEYIANQYYAE